MTRIIRLGLLAAIFIASTLPAWGLSGGEGLAGTPHDFTAGGTGDVRGVEGIGLCTYCHTPQRASSTPLLWNHTASRNTFRWDVSSTTAGTRLPAFSGASYRGPSARCLSCHDGSVAIGDVSLAEGSGPGEPGSAGSMRMTDFAAKYQIGANGDLSGNHPVGVPFPMGRMPGTYNGVTNGSAHGTFVAADWQANPLAFGRARVRLYQEDTTGQVSAISSSAVAMNAGVECSSCHDPHNKESVDDMFLRGRRTGRSQSDGYLCQQCHNM